jgi:hypothetical protein
MAQMVFIREISPTTFLHFSTRGDAFCLRDYSASATAPPVEVMRQDVVAGITAGSIEAKARQSGNRMLPAPAEPWENAEFWHNHVLGLNRQYLPSNPPPGPPPTAPQTSVRRMAWDGLTWEYKSLWIRSDYLEADLNRLGEQGWELLTVHSLDRRDPFLCLLKRPRVCGRRGEEDGD